MTETVVLVARVSLMAIVTVTETSSMSVEFVEETTQLVPIVVGCQTETELHVTELVALATTTLLVMDVPILLLRTTIRQRPLTMGLAYMQCVTSPQTIKRLMMMEQLLWTSHRITKTLMMREQLLWTSHRITKPFMMELMRMERLL